MAYVALYRKYRSQSFGELMGQEQVTTTLQNAIKSGKIGHAYLFYGARGCGKTSTARLLARALNCIAQDGPTPEPCGECRLCVSIRDGACMDVVEMDAASETGIDDVREKIIENVQYAPGEARYKVYIIDEVHDLSAKAFDALLKTLEEPPGHVVFILATTELHKVPITIRSRCQTFPFRRGSLQDLAASIQRVIDAEGYTAEPEAVQTVARCAEGSWRDALSLLEQVMAYSDGQITAETVNRALGTVGAESLSRVVETLARGQWDEVIEIAGELINSGTDARQLLVALSGHLRAVMLVASGAKQAALQEYGSERVAALTPQAALFDPATLLIMLGELATAEREIRFTNQHRWLLERTLLRLIPGNLALQAEPRSATVRPAVQETAQRPSIPAVAPPAATPTIVPRPPTPEVRERAMEATTLPPKAEPEWNRTPEHPNTRTPEYPIQNPKPKIQNPESPTPPPSPSFAEEISLEVIQRAWPRILKLFQKASPSGYPFIEKARVAALEGKFVVLRFADRFARDRINNNERGKTRFEEKLNEGLQTQGYKLRCEVDDDIGMGAELPASLPPTNANAPVVGTLLEAPPPLPTNTPTRIADFDMPVALPPPTPSVSSNGAAPERNGATSQPPSEPPPTAEKDFLREVLDLFGGEVIRSEPKA